VTRLLVSTRSRHLWSIDELLVEVRRSISTADFSTVFRAVNVLEREGRLSRVDLGDGKVHYERAGGHHDHIQCVSCGKVSALPECVLQQSAGRVEQRTGYEVSGHRLLFTGRCPSCRSRGAPSVRRSATPAGAP
jgi:Fe2+ or Zn2+ uptake regulation protein